MQDNSKYIDEIMNKERNRHRHTNLFLFIMTDVLRPTLLTVIWTQYTNNTDKTFGWVPKWAGMQTHRQMGRLTDGQRQAGTG